MNFSPAYAHITKQFGNMSIEVGWTNEPALVGELNSALIVVEKVTGGNSTPVSNALAQMDVAVKYGGITKPLDFEPSEQTEGGYEAQLIPTRIGSYGLSMNGSIQSQNITNVEIPLDEVEGTQKLSFPDSGGSTSVVGNGQATASNNNIGPRLEEILGQLSNDIDSTKSSIAKLDSKYTDLQKSIQDAKASSDISFMVGMIGIGTGVSGIIISLIVVYRKIQ